MQFNFDDVEVDNEQKTLLKAGQLIECEPRVFALLVYFCQHPNEAISRATLIENVWHGRIVSDAAVNRAVGELRKLIEWSPTAPQYIKTVSKVGYRFESEVTNRSTAQQSIASSQPKPLIYLSMTILMIIFVAVAYFYLNANSKLPLPLKVKERVPLTTSIGIAFNPFYDKKNDQLYYLFREGMKDVAQVYYLNSLGEHQKLTNDNFYYTDVILSPSGRIFAARLNNLTERLCDIVEIEKETGQVESIVSCQQSIVTHLAFDASQRRLIYRNREHVAQPYSVFSYHLDTHRKSQLTRAIQQGNNLGDYVFSLSPDESQLAVIAYQDSSEDMLKLINLTTNQTVKKVPLAPNVFSLLWQDETTILFSTEDGLYSFDLIHNTINTIEKSDQFGRITQGKHYLEVLTERSHQRVNIYGISLKDSTSMLSPLTQSTQLSTAPVFGNKTPIMAFKTTRSGTIDVHLKQEGKQSVKVQFNDEISYVSAMAWSPDDEYLVAGINGRLYLCSLANSTWQAITSNTLKVHHVAFVKKDIFFSAEVEGQWNIWRMALDGSNHQQVTFKGGYSIQGNDSHLFYTKFNETGLYTKTHHSPKESLLIEKFPVKNWRHWQLRDSTIYIFSTEEITAFDIEKQISETFYPFDNAKPTSCHVAFQHNYVACSLIEESASNLWKITLSQL